MRLRHTHIRNMGSPRPESKIPRVALKGRSFCSPANAIAVDDGRQEIPTAAIDDTQDAKASRSLIRAEAACAIRA
jgi:hypothetical protein